MGCGNNGSLKKKIIAFSSWNVTYMYQIISIIIKAWLFNSLIIETPQLYNYYINVTVLYWYLNQNIIYFIPSPLSLCIIWWINKRCILQWFVMQIVMCERAWYVFNELCYVYWCYITNSITVIGNINDYCSMLNMCDL